MRKRTTLFEADCAWSRGSCASKTHTRATTVLFVTGVPVQSSEENSIPPSKHKWEFRRQKEVGTGRGSRLRRLPKGGRAPSRPECPGSSGASPSRGGPPPGWLRRGRERLSYLAPALRSLQGHLAGLACAEEEARSAILLLQQRAFERLRGAA